MPVTLINQKPSFIKKVESIEKLSIAELFGNTIQGEGVNTGIPATFLRLQGCTLLCSWCDTLDVWNKGNEYSFDEIFELFEKYNLIGQFKQGQHLVLTGGSPLKQQKQLVSFINKFTSKYNFKPYLEIENEAVLSPCEEIKTLIACWNNSPKLANSGMKEKVRYKPNILKETASLPNSWFKFVVSSESDWQEIKRDYLDTQIVDKEQIIIMPEGQTQDELKLHYEVAVEIAIRENVRFCNREHIVLWNKKTGV